MRVCARARARVCVCACVCVWMGVRVSVRVCVWTGVPVGCLGDGLQGHALLEHPRHVRILVRHGRYPQIPNIGHGTAPKACITL